MTERVAVIGAYSGKIGELWDKSWRDLAEEAGLGALKDAGISKHQVDEIYVGNMGLEMYFKQSHLNSLIYEAFFNGSMKRAVPITRVEAACASGGKALEQAYLSVQAGLYRGRDKIVMAAGGEKMRDASTAYTTRMNAAAADVDEEVLIGKNFPSINGEIANRYLHETGATEDDLHIVAVKNHNNASLNPNAHYPFKITLDAVRKSPYVSKPLRLLDCSGISDGAAATILTSERMAKQIGADYVIFDSVQSDCDKISLHRRPSITSLSAVRRAAENAYKESQISPSNIDVAELHDAFTIMEVIAYEDLGFAKKGQGYKLAKEIQESGNELKFNPSGGLKARGHPVGATGVIQAVEIVNQIRGRCGARQVDDIEYGLAQNIGGVGGTAVVSIFKKA